MSKSVIFLVKSFLGNFYKHLAIFFWSHDFLLVTLVLWHISINRLLKLGKILSKQHCKQGWGGGQVVSMLAIYSDNPSSNPTDAYSFFCKIYVWKDRKQTKRVCGWPLKNPTQCRGGGLVASGSAFFSASLSLNPFEFYSFNYVHCRNIHIFHVLVFTELLFVLA